MTVGELHVRMSGAEFDEWQAFAKLEPFGEWRADYRAGLQAAVTYNMNRARDAEPRSALDFMPLLDRPEPPPVNPERIRQKLLAWLPPSQAAAGAES